jgi:hypothetical protein
VEQRHWWIVTEKRDWEWGEEILRNKDKQNETSEEFENIIVYTLNKK